MVTRREQTMILLGIVGVFVVSAAVFFGTLAFLGWLIGGYGL
jgi:hypothetical protein